MDAILAFLRDHWIKFLVCVVLGFLCLLTYNFTNGSWTRVDSYMDGCFIGGFALIAIGGLSWINNLGGFDIASFYIRRKNIGERKEDYYEYGERRKEERSRNKLTFLPYIIVGSLYLIASLILMIFR